MLTIFGAPWAELSLEDVKGFLDQADDEPLLWEAKGTKLEKNEFVDRSAHSQIAMRVAI